MPHARGRPVAGLVPTATAPSRDAGTEGLDLPAPLTPIPTRSFDRVESVAVGDRFVQMPDPENILNRARETSDIPKRSCWTP